MTLNRKSDSSIGVCLLTRGIILPDFIPILFGTTEPWAFWRDSPNNNNNNKQTNKIYACFGTFTASTFYV